MYNLKNLLTVTFSSVVHHPNSRIFSQVLITNTVTSRTHLFHRSIHSSSTKLNMSTKARTALDEMSKDGTFQRKEAAWRNFISRDEGAKFPPEAGRLLKLFQA